MFSKKFEIILYHHDQTFLDFKSKEYPSNESKQIKVTNLTFLLSYMDKKKKR